MKVLIVEDEKKTGEYLTKGLTEAGFVVDLADNGLNGYHLAMTGDYDLLILDIMLPDIDGFEVCRRIRALQGPAARVPSRRPGSRPSTGGMPSSVRPITAAARDAPSTELCSPSAK